MSLEKQVQIYSIDTGNFYTNKETRLHILKHKLKTEKNELRQNNTKIISELDKLNVKTDKTTLLSIFEDKSDLSIYRNPNDILKLVRRYYKNLEYIDYKNQKLKECEERFNTLLENKTELNIKQKGKHHKRVLNDNSVSNKKIISVFESAFTRTIGAKIDELSEDFMVVQIYYFQIAKDIIFNGFYYNGEKYIYFTSSAGQIRTKKAVFIKESVWNKYEKTIMCGLTIDKINSNGGSNPNKFLAYIALSSSATDLWSEFNIDRSIVIDDFETNVFGTYDFIDETDYSIKRTSGYIPITHTDGAGMMLPEMGKNRMVRLPFIKGLLGTFDFVKFIKVNGCSPVIKDIYGTEHNIIEENIQVIFCKSQFKFWNQYSSWEDYKFNFKKYNCTANFTNLERDKIKNASINYQMLQTLTDITDDEIKALASKSVNKLNNICSSKNTIKDIFGINAYNTNPTYFQQAVMLYENLLNDEYAKRNLREIKNSMVKRYKSGKLDVNGKYTFVLPDFYAACQYWFMNVENPDGLLNDGEVFCWLFRKQDKLDCLRSPHLFVEHGVRKNISNKDLQRQFNIRQWFGTNAIYTSCKDFISKLLQFDCDGDTLLVVADDNLIRIAERNLKKYDIVPLYYNMKKAESKEINNENIYNGLNAAFVGGNIGIYSNNISKIWNNDVFINGKQEDKIKAVDCVKRLCCQDNYVIDYAKTLYKPEFPDIIQEEIQVYTKELLPHFFKYAKDKKEKQITCKNNSLVNSLEDIISNPKIRFKNSEIGKVDFKLLMSNPDIKYNISFNNKRKLNKNKTEPMLLKYCELSRTYFFKSDAQSLTNSFSHDFANNHQIKNELMFRKINSTVKNELSKFGLTNEEVVDILVDYLYNKTKSNPNKGILWLCYGDILVKNLKSNGCKLQEKTIQCIDCGEWFNVGIKNTKTCRCNKCQNEYRTKYQRELMREVRNNKT